ncbi:hypothetical protein [Aestuariibaculum lutulentum]|uniref:Uncharacterized protein n=1 Tax=Aestuariibaculum lutulentum TaxID=2920935 RepID=A0ABS9RID8_9FLAO|nr:hypothetical protein [Aestuariibaculum lutulentum]MCH4552708.1 hypothetical protein [Aestuariibaculum lutulentum]
MKSELTHVFLAVLMLIGVSTYSQNFDLPEPNKKLLRTAYQDDKESKDIIYHYLIQNYRPTSERTNVQKVDYGEFPICAFEQTFEYGIKFTTENCREAGGISMSLELPKISEKEVKVWIEKIYDADLTEIENEWYENKNTYGPIGGGAGCHYELKYNINKWIIDIYCGC